MLLEPVIKEEIGMKTSGVHNNYVRPSYLLLHPFPQITVRRTHKHDPSPERQSGAQAYPFPVLKFVAYKL